MGMTFGDSGFGHKTEENTAKKPKVSKISSYNKNSPSCEKKQGGLALDIIYENENVSAPFNKDKIETDSNGFKENMLLSFYNWPKIETSAVF